MHIQTHAREEAKRHSLSLSFVSTTTTTSTNTSSTPGASCIDEARCVCACAPLSLSRCPWECMSVWRRSPHQASKGGQNSRTRFPSPLLAQCVALSKEGNSEGR